MYYKDGIRCNDNLHPDQQLQKDTAFTEEAGDSYILPSVAFEGVKLFTENEDVSKQPFYIKGYFGSTANGEAITKVVTNRFKTIKGNTFILQREDKIVKLLIIDSPKDCTFSSVIDDAARLSSAINGIGLSSGLCLAKLSVGLFV